MISFTDILAENQQAYELQFSLLSVTFFPQRSSIAWGIKCDTDGRETSQEPA